MEKAKQKHARHFKPITWQKLEGADTGRANHFVCFLTGHNTLLVNGALQFCVTRKLLQVGDSAFGAVRIHRYAEGVVQHSTLTENLKVNIQVTEKE